MRKAEWCRGWTFGVVLLLCMLAAATEIGAADEGMDSLERQLSEVADDFVETLGETGDGRRVIAVMPFSESGQEYHRRLGVRAAEILERHISEEAPDWLAVQDRMNLPDILEEHKLWVDKIVEEKESDNGDATELLERADYLVVGNTTERRREADLELRLIRGQRAEQIDSGSVTVKLTPEITRLMAVVDAKQHVDDADGADRVRMVETEVKAQRVVNPLQRVVKEWDVEGGETLQGGDQIRFTLTPDADCYLYVLMYGSDERLHKLFPTDDWEESFEATYGHEVEPRENYCRAEYTYHIPGSYRPGSDRPPVQRYYRLDHTPGTNIVYVVADRDEVKNLGDLRRRLEGDSHKRRLRRLKQEFDYVDVFRFDQE